MAPRFRSPPAQPVLAPGPLAARPVLAPVRLAARPVLVTVRLAAQRAEYAV